MPRPLDAPAIGLLDDIHEVVSSSLLEIAGAFSAMLRPLVAHSSLIIFTEDCTGMPQKKAGDASIIDRVTIAELDVVRERMLERSAAAWGITAMIARSERPAAAWLASTGALLVLTDPVSAPVSAPDGDRTQGDVLSLVSSLWQLVADSIRQQVAAASPDYLRDSRMASTERARVIADLTDAHSTTLDQLLAVLRSRETADSAARQTATDLAASAMVALRAVSDRDRYLSEEPVSRAFERLKEDLRPLARFGNLDIQFVEPPTDGRALPGEVAHASRAIVRGAVLALVDQPGVERLRVEWGCDGSNLLIGIRDDGPGDLTASTPSVKQLAARVTALDGHLNVNGTAGWGSDISVVLPLDVPSIALKGTDDWQLTARERDVLDLVASGARNRAIATSLSISENTVKFHVANLLRKANASNRAELVSSLR